MSTAAVPVSGDLVLTNARVWAGPDAAISDPQPVTIRGGAIAAVGGAADGLPRFDAGGRVVTAGFWNCHVHFTEPVWTGAATAPAGRLQPALDDMLLRRGFTTVLDLASNRRDTVPLAQRIASGELRGPGIVTAAGALYPWAGIPFYVRPTIPWYLRGALPTPLTAAGARRVVAAQHRHGAGITKLFTGSYTAPGRVKAMREAVARAAVRTAHERGMPVLAHPSDSTGTRVAIEAGVDALAHVPDSAAGVPALLQDAAARGVRIVPTLHMFAATVTTADGYLEPIRDALRTFLAAGGRVLFGTDVGYLPDRDTRPEYAAMAACGMSAPDILRSLTVEPATFLGRIDQGRVAVGLRGDLTVLETRAATPTATDFADVHSVIRDGRVIFREEAPPRRTLEG